MKAKITKLVKKAAGNAEIKPTTVLVTSGLIDSLFLIDLITQLEEEFSITFTPEEMVPENFDSIEKLAALIGGKKK